MSILPGGPLHLNLTEDDDEDDIIGAFLLSCGQGHTPEADDRQAQDIRQGGDCGDQVCRDTQKGVPCDSLEEERQSLGVQWSEGVDDETIYSAELEDYRHEHRDSWDAADEDDDGEDYSDSDFGDCYNYYDDKHIVHDAEYFEDDDDVSRLVEQELLRDGYIECSCGNWLLPADACLECGSLEDEKFPGCMPAKEKSQDPEYDAQAREEGDSTKNEEHFSKSITEDVNDKKLDEEFHEVREETVDEKKRRKKR